MLQVKDYHEKKYEGGGVEEKEEEKVNDRVEVAKDGLGLILERWECEVPPRTSTTFFTE